MSRKIVKAHIEQITPLTDSITQLILIPEEYVDYQAGQYLQILLGEEALSYSIANAPLGSRKYELHIRHNPENFCMQRLFAHIKKEESVTINLPFGDCSLEHLEVHRPILFIAAGTGFAPVKAMIEQLLFNADRRSFELFWGARMQNDLYMDEKVTQWQAHVSGFHYFSSLSAENSQPLISFVVARHLADLNDWQIVISGPYDMVYSTRDALIEYGVEPEHLFSDAFSFLSK
ncbi:NAD(P)H-flavin reductase [Legionella sp.]|uniref:NAD(P)H-flavin reductase n=1 Tax=Legionella sp. TaxID=459 RepID=UPI003CA4FC5A